MIIVVIVVVVVVPYFVINLATSSTIDGRHSSIMALHHFHARVEEEERTL